MRPAFYGELVFPRSRAVDVDFGDDFEEDAPPSSEIRVDSKADVSKLGSLKYLILACGRQPSDFARLCLLPDSKSEVFTVKIFRPRTEEDQDQAAGTNFGSPSSILSFYHVPSSSSLVGVTSSTRAPDPDTTIAVVGKIFDQLASIASNLIVLTLDFKPAASYRTVDRSFLENKVSTSGIVRVLVSRHGQKSNLSTLEVPNLLDGLAAAVTTYCELNGIPAMTYVLYGQDTCDATSIHVGTYRASLGRDHIWKSLLLTQENESALHNKLAGITQRNPPLSSIFG